MIWRTGWFEHLQQFAVGLYNCVAYNMLRNACPHPSKGIGLVDLVMFLQTLREYLSGFNKTRPCLGHIDIQLADAVREECFS